MKTIRLFFLFSFISGFSLAQSYTNLLDNQNEWQLISCYLNDCFRDAYYTKGDTVVNNKNYKVLDAYHYISRTFLLREEVENKQVFLLKLDGERTNEYLLYDFSLQESDSIHLYNPFSPFATDAGFFKVDSIRNKPINNTVNRRFFYLSATENNPTQATNKPIWVEGLGSLSLINAPGGLPDYNQVGQVTCMFKNGELFYADYSRQSICMSVLGVKNIRPTKKQFVWIGKNEAMMMDVSKNAQLSWFSSVGNSVHVPKHWKNNRWIFDFSSVPEGIYYLRVEEESSKYLIPIIRP